MSILLVLIFAGNSYNVPIHSTNSTNFDYTNSISDDESYEHRNPNLGIYAAETGAALLAGNAAAVGLVVLLSLEYESPSGTHLVSPGIVGSNLYILHAFFHVCS